MSTMSTMAKNVIAAGSKNHPPILERIAKDICDIVKLLMEGSELPLQERESKLYNEFDKFTSKKGETIHLYYLRFAKLINNMHTIRMTMKPLQVNTKFVNHLQPEWSKFVTNVKLAKDMHNSNFDQLYEYLRQHEAYANEVRMMRQRFLDPFALVSNSYNSPPVYTSHQSQYNQHISAIPQQQQIYSSLQQQQSYQAPAVHQQSYQAPAIHQQSYQAPIVHQQAYEAQLVLHQPPTVFP
ncbi:hypothetical protein Tco_0971885 [Tanacetum coccineum]